MSTPEPRPQRTRVSSIHTRDADYTKDGAEGSEDEADYEGGASRKQSRDISTEVEVGRVSRVLCPVAEDGHSIASK